MCFRIGGSTIRVSVAEGGATSERDSAAGGLHDTAGRARLSHHRIRRIRFLTVSTRRDIFDRRCPDAIYDLSRFTSFWSYSIKVLRRLEAN